ncbi:MAG: hypothetical protein R3F33_01235 [Planctomycetota bacterium]
MLSDAHVIDLEIINPADERESNWGSWIEEDCEVEPVGNSLLEYAEWVVTLPDGERTVEWVLPAQSKRSAGRAWLPGVPARLEVHSPFEGRLMALDLTVEQMASLAEVRLDEPGWSMAAGGWIPDPDGSWVQGAVPPGPDEEVLVELLAVEPLHALPLYRTWSSPGPWSSLLPPRGLCSAGMQTIHSARLERGKSFAFSLPRAVWGRQFWLRASSDRGSSVEFVGSPGFQRLQWKGCGWLGGTVPEIPSGGGYAVLALERWGFTATAPIDPATGRFAFEQLPAGQWTLGLMLGDGEVEFMTQTPDAPASRRPVIEVAPGGSVQTGPLRFDVAAVKAVVQMEAPGEAEVKWKLDSAYGGRGSPVVMNPADSGAIEVFGIRPRGGSNQVEIFGSAIDRIVHWRVAADWNGDTVQRRTLPGGIRHLDLRFPAGVAIASDADCGVFIQGRSEDGLEYHSGDDGSWEELNAAPFWVAPGCEVGLEILGGEFFRGQVRQEAWTEASKVGASVVVELQRARP